MLQCCISDIMKTPKKSFKLALKSVVGSQFSNKEKTKKYMLRKTQIFGNFEIL